MIVLNSGSIPLSGVSYNSCSCYGFDKYPEEIGEVISTVAFDARSFLSALLGKTVKILAIKLFGKNASTQHFFQNIPQQVRITKKSQIN